MKQSISDHALIRFIERVHNIDTARLRGSLKDHEFITYLQQALGIDTEDLRHQCLSLCADQLRSGIKYADIGGHTYIAMNGSIVTILPKERIARKIRLTRKEVRNCRRGGNFTAGSDEIPYELIEPRFHRELSV